MIRGFAKGFIVCSLAVVMVAGGANLAAGGVPALLEEILDSLVVSVGVDEDACAAVAAQCSDGGTGHTFSGASSSNHNPVLLVVSVTQQGSPVSGLTSTNFAFKGISVPAGGLFPVQCPAGGSGCAASANFKEILANPGTYQLWVHPGPTGSWKAGTHFATLTVTDDFGSSARGLVEIEIP